MVGTQYDLAMDCLPIGFIAHPMFMGLQFKNYRSW